MSTETKATHSPGPFHAACPPVGRDYLTVAGCSVIAVGADKESHDYNEHDMPFIARACNAHDDLLDVCKRFAKTCEGCDLSPRDRQLYRDALSAIAKATQ